MYTDEDLENASQQGIFNQQQIKQFRDYISQSNNTSHVDEENIRLVASFNDVFVVIASLLLLLSAAWVGHSVHLAVSTIAVAALSWLLAEFFVRHRKMALPAIFLLITYVISVFISVLILYVTPIDQRFAEYWSSGNAMMLASTVTIVATWLHWRRFSVPLTLAAGAISVVIFTISLLVSIVPWLKNYISALLFISGIIVFYFAMRWDSADIERVSRKSDIAFWLHLVASPLIVHPIFSLLGVFDGERSQWIMLFILLIYFLLVAISLIIDRRAFMVSALIYVLIAFAALFKTFGFAGDGIAVVGLVISAGLLLLSGFWHRARRLILKYLPASITSKVPTID